MAKIPAWQYRYHFEDRKDIHEFVKNLEKYGFEVLSNSHYPHPRFEKAYHVGKATIVLGTECGLANYGKPADATITTYGTLDTRITKLLEEFGKKASAFQSHKLST